MLVGMDGGYLKFVLWYNRLNFDMGSYGLYIFILFFGVNGDVLDIFFISD